MHIREPTADDADAVGRMHLACWREADTPLLGPDFFDAGTEARWIERWRADLAAPEPSVALRIAVGDDGARSEAA